MRLAFSLSLPMSALRQHIHLVFFFFCWPVRERFTLKKRTLKATDKYSHWEFFPTYPVFCEQKLTIVGTHILIVPQLNVQSPGPTLPLRRDLLGMTHWAIGHHAGTPFTVRKIQIQKLFVFTKKRKKIYNMYFSKHVSFKNQFQDLGCVCVAVMRSYPLETRIIQHLTRPRVQREQQPDTEVDST